MNIARIEKPAGNGEVSTLYDANAGEARENGAAGWAPQRERTTLPEFPRAAWRGLFANYRNAMERATEASDAFHFAALWARCAVALGRRVHFPYGMQLFPNVYLVCFGPTGDRKTTATRLGAEIGGAFKVVRGGGSGEGLADGFSSAEPGLGLLLYAEEFSQVLRAGRWDGATLIPFLTQCFDCPPRYEMKFRKSPVGLEQPTPSLLAGATPDWFWQDFRANDFQGGFGNRLFFLRGHANLQCRCPSLQTWTQSRAPWTLLQRFSPAKRTLTRRLVGCGGNSTARGMPKRGGAIHCCLRR